MAGVAALMKEADYALKPDEIENIIKEEAYDIGEFGWDKETAYGLVSPYRSMQHVLSEYK